MYINTDRINELFSKYKAKLEQIFGAVDWVTTKEEKENNKKEIVPILKELFELTAEAKKGLTIPVYY
jgi:hypothetical protein